MAYKLQLDQPLSIDIKRIAEEQASKALVGLYTIQQASDNYDAFSQVLDEEVHEVRKLLKKSRGLLRLVRDELGEDVYKRENTCYRDVGRLFSDLRDHFVMVKTLEKQQDSAGGLSDAFLDEVRSALEAKHEAARRSQYHDNERIRHAIVELEMARTRISTWPLQEDGYEAIRKGLWRTYKRGRKRMRKAYDDPKPARFHELRKRIKYHWYHMRILKPLWSPVLKSVAKEIHNVSDYLGDYHDIAELQQTLAGLRGVGDDDQMLLLHAMLSRRQQHLISAAKSICASIYVESPKRFSNRIGGYWAIAMQSTKAAS